MKEKGLAPALVIIIGVVVGLIALGAYKVHYAPIDNNSSGDAVSNYRQGLIEKQDKTNPGSNLQPMYGGTEKTTQQKQVDQEFIDTVVEQYGSKEAAAKAHIDFGWQYFQKGDFDTAMKRFNQAWLLDPNNPGIYWGFAEVLLYRDKNLDDAISMFEKSLSLGPNQEKVNRIYCDLGYVYGLKGEDATSSEQKDENFKKAEDLYKKGINIDQKDEHCLPNIAVLKYVQGEYAEAWDYVHQARSMGSQRLEVDFKDFLQELSAKMSDPENK